MLSIGSKRWSQLSSFTGMRTHKWWIAQQYLSAYHEIADICTYFFFFFIVLPLHGSICHLSQIEGICFHYFLIGLKAQREFFFFLCSTWAHTVSSSHQLWCHVEKSPKTPSGFTFWTSGETQRDSIVASIGMNTLVMLTEILLTIEWIWIDLFFGVCVYMNIY